MAPETPAKPQKTISARVSFPSIKLDIGGARKMSPNWRQPNLQKQIERAAQRRTRPSSLVPEAKAKPHNKSKNNFENLGDA